MMKKLLALGFSLGLILSLGACGATGEQLPALVLESSSSQQSGGETSGVESGAQPTVEEVPDTEFPDTLDGLCDFLTANKAVAGEPTEMAYETIGAQDGYRFRFILNGSTVQVEVYSYDVNNLNEQGQTVLDSVKAEGSFTMLDNDVPATLNSDGKYMLLYTDGRTSAENTAQRERVLQLFEAFKVDN